MNADNPPKLTVREVALMGIMTAILEVSVHLLAPLPNVEPVTLLVILYTLVLGKRVSYVLTAYILFEGFAYGFGVWWLSYLYIWPLLAVIAFLFRKRTSPWVFSIIAGSFGLCFGMLCSLPYLFIGGPIAAFNWWVAGIPYDLIHCAANFILCLAFFTPLLRLLKRLYRQAL
ncbi:MAG: hypothetical protein NC094_03575 [Bacteroidales bacterium]|nr:hypothetical protein [Lachnoclostridium sp.]MCM1383870.1 hypothetical protein [Lachnoclostridium sp.]MCM1464477.1 hypothetical protein [Bacteroidales bacterium]